MNQTRIAFVDDAIGVGGAEVLLMDLIEGLSAMGIAPMIYCDPGSALARLATERGIQTVEFSCPKLLSVSVVIGERKVVNPFAIIWDSIALIVSGVRLSRRLRARGFDIVQTNSAFAHIYGGLAASLAGVPCIWYFHDLVETRRLRGAAQRVWRCLASRLCSLIVGDSLAVVTSLGVGKKAKVIHPFAPAMPASDDVPLRARLNLSSNIRVVGFIGRIAYTKGLDVLVETAQEVVAADPLVHFIVIGEAQPDETGYKNSLVLEIANLGLKDNWHWLGAQPQAARFVSQFDLLVLPSRREAFGLVLLEAANAGKAVVASSVGGVPEIIEDGKTGLLVRPEEPKQMASAILSLLSRPDIRESMGGRARSEVKLRFSPEQYFAKFLAVYKTLIFRTT